MTYGRLDGWSGLDKCARTVLRKPGGSAPAMVDDGRPRLDQSRIFSMFTGLVRISQHHISVANSFMKRSNNLGLYLPLWSTLEDVL